MPKLDKDSRKENYRPKFLVNINVKTFRRYSPVKFNSNYKTHSA
jgi:hypothetical protein